jgi:hypothetical protein
MAEVHLQLETVRVVDDSLDDSVLDSPVMQIDADFVANAELSVIWFRRRGHAGEFTPYG